MLDTTKKVPPLFLEMILTHNGINKKLYKTVLSTPFSHFLTQNEDFAEQNQPFLFSLLTLNFFSPLPSEPRRRLAIPRLFALRKDLSPRSPYDRRIYPLRRYQADILLSRRKAPSCRS